MHRHNENPQCYRVHILEDVIDEAQKSNILEVKDLPPHLKYVLLRKNQIQPDLIFIPLSSLEKEKPKRVLRKNEGSHRRNTPYLRGRNQMNNMHEVKIDFKQIGYTNTSL